MQAFSALQFSANLPCLQSKSPECMVPSLPTLKVASDESCVGPQHGSLVSAQPGQSLIPSILSRICGGVGGKRNRTMTPALQPNSVIQSISEVCPMESSGTNSCVYGSILLQDPLASVSITGQAQCGSSLQTSTKSYHKPPSHGFYFLVNYKSWFSHWFDNHTNHREAFLTWAWLVERSLREHMDH